MYSHPAQLVDNRNCVLCMTCDKVRLRCCQCPPASMPLLPHPNPRTVLGVSLSRSGAGAVACAGMAFHNSGVLCVAAQSYLKLSCMCVQAQAWHGSAWQPKSLKNPKTCVRAQACPHDSVELRLRPPGIDLWTSHKPMAAELALQFTLLGAGRHSITSCLMHDFRHVPRWTRGRKPLDVSDHV